MKKQLKIFSILLVACLGVSAMFVCAEEAQMPKSRYAYYRDKLKQRWYACVKKVKEVAQDEAVQEKVVKGLLFIAAVLMACWLGSRSWGSRARVGTVIWQSMQGNSEAKQVCVPTQRGLDCGFHAVNNGFEIIYSILNKCALNFSNQDFRTSAMQAIHNNCQWRVKEMELDAAEVRQCGLAGSDRPLIVDEVSGVINLLPNDYSDCFVICSADHSFNGGRIVGFDHLADHITGFKQDNSQQILAIIIHAGGFHWLVDVLHKHVESEQLYYRHIIADSTNGCAGNMHDVQQVIAIERRVQ